MAAGRVIAERVKWSYFDATSWWSEPISAWPSRNAISPKLRTEDDSTSSPKPFAGELRRCETSSRTPCIRSNGAPNHRATLASKCAGKIDAAQSGDGSHLAFRWAGATSRRGRNSMALTDQLVAAGMSYVPQLQERFPIAHRHRKP